MASSSQTSKTQTHQESIISTADLLKNTSADLIKFAAQYPTNQPVLIGFTTASDLISANLQSLSTALSAYGPKISVEDSLTTPLVAAIRAVAEKVAKGLAEGVEAEKEYGDEWEDLERVGAVAAERSRAMVRSPNMYTHAGCVRFLRVMGGLEDAEQLLCGMDELKSLAFYVTKMVRYLGLKKGAAE